MLSKARLEQISEMEGILNEADAFLAEAEAFFEKWQNFLPKMEALSVIILMAIGERIMRLMNKARFLLICLVAF